MLARLGDGPSWASGWEQTFTLLSKSAIFEARARLVALAECGTHALFDVIVGGYVSSEVALASGLIERLRPGMLVPADRGFYSFTLWCKAIATGADLLWRAKTGLRPQHLQTLDDDTWRAQIRPSGEKTVGACFSVDA